MSDGEHQAQQGPTVLNPTHQPSAVAPEDLASSSEVRRTIEIAWVVAKADLKQRYLGSFFGFLWTLIRPLLLYIVLYVVFTNLVARSAIDHYPVYLLMAFTFWGFFAEVTSSSLASLVAREAILRKIKIPIFSVPLATLMFAAVQFAAALIVLFLFVVISGITPQLGWLALPLILFALAIFSASVGWLLSIAYVYFRDVGPVWEVTAQVLFWATPIIYDAMTLPKPLRDILAINPLSPLFSLSRRLLIDSSAPTLGQIYSPAALIASATLFLGVVIAGPIVFRRFAPAVTEKL